MNADVHQPAQVQTSPPDGEQQRLSDLYDHGVLDGASNQQLDRIVSLAAEILGTPSP